MKNIEKISQENLSEPGFITLVFEFLKIIFKLSLINFEKKNSKFTIKKNFDDFFEKKIMDDKKSFTNFICNISEELKYINEFLKADSKDKDFKPKDLNLDILMLSVNNCYLFCTNNINEDILIKGLKDAFKELIKRKRIQTNIESKGIISEFYNNIDSFSNYLNEIKGKNPSNKIEEKKEDLDEEYYLNEINKLKNEITDYEKVLETKNIEIKTADKKIDELSFELSENKIKSALDKSSYEDFKKEIKNILSQNNKEINSLKSKMQNMDGRMKNIEDENRNLKAKLTLSEKKIVTLLTFVNSIREDMNKLVEIGKDLSKNLDETSKLLMDVKYVLDNYDNELDNLDHII